MPRKLLDAHSRAAEEVPERSLFSLFYQA